MTVPCGGGFKLVIQEEVIEIYTISEFSKITNLSVKALRYYDEQGLLKPAKRGDNEYRMYSEENYTTARRIKFLRELSFSIVEIRDVLEHCTADEDLQFFLAEKKEKIAEQISKEKNLMDEISKHLQQTKKMEASIMSYEFEIKEISATKVASVRFKGSFKGIGFAMSTLFSEVKGKAAGPALCIYHSEDYDENSEIEACVPVKEAIRVKKTSVYALPAVKALCTTHVGSYDELHIAYKAIMDYAKNNGMKMLLPWREVYIKGPGLAFKGNPSKYVTEIQIPYSDE